MTDADPTALRAEHDAMLRRLSERRSTLHFAHAAIGMLIGLILSGTAGKLWWDFGELHGIWAALVGAAGLTVMVYASARWLLGRRALALEVSEFEKLKSLRRVLALDDPASMLP